MTDETTNVTPEAEVEATEVTPVTPGEGSEAEVTPAVDTPAEGEETAV